MSDESVPGPEQMLAAAHAVKAHLGPNVFLLLAWGPGFAHLPVQGTYLSNSPALADILVRVRQLDRLLMEALIHGAPGPVAAGVGGRVDRLRAWAAGAPGYEELPPLPEDVMACLDTVGALDRALRRSPPCACEKCPRCEALNFARLALPGLAGERGG